MIHQNSKFMLTCAPAAVALMLAATGAHPPATAAQTAAPGALPFAPVQREMFAVANSLANAWGDYDNDGDLDLSVMSYEGAVGQQTPLNSLFRNDGAAGFVDVLSKDSPLNAGDHGVQFVDFDNDGGLDLTLTDGYGPTGGHFVFRNTLPADAKHRSLSVLVLDAKGHFTQFGAEVRLFDASGRTVASRQVVTGGGYNTERATPVHFGLARAQPLRVEVTFMSKDGRKTQTVSGVNPANYRGKSLVVRRAP